MTLERIAERDALHHSLEKCDPQWLRQLTRGVSLLILTAVWTFCSGFYIDDRDAFVFGVAVIPAWVLSAWALWKLAAPEPDARLGLDRGVLLIRVIVVILLCTPVLLIEPGDLRWGEPGT